MSSMIEPTLEFFVSDAIFDQAKVAEVVAILEPLRGMIEDCMSGDYDADEMSWRDYRNSLWENVVESDPKIKEKVDAILGQ